MSRETGVYDEWNEFGNITSPSAIGICNVHINRGIIIADISKGVCNGNQTNHAFVRDLDLQQNRHELSEAHDIYAVLITASMHDGSYQVHGQARLEYYIDR